MGLLGNRTDTLPKRPKWRAEGHLTRQIQSPSDCFLCSVYMVDVQFAFLSQWKLKCMKMTHCDPFTDCTMAVNKYN